MKGFKSLRLVFLSVEAKKEYYLVNPKYVYKGSKSARLKLLETLVKERVQQGRDLKGLVDQAHAKFLKK